MISQTPMGPGFFFFFRNETIESGGYKEPNFFNYDGYVPKFKAVGKEQRKAKRVVEKIAKIVLATPNIETNKEIELMLRLRLEYEGLIYKQLYLRWIIKQAEKERQKRVAVILLLLH